MLIKTTRNGFGTRITAIRTKEAQEVVWHYKMSKPPLSKLYNNLKNFSCSKSRYNVFEQPDEYLPESSNLFNPHGPPSLGLNQRPPSYQGVPPGALGAGVLGER